MKCRSNTAGAMLLASLAVGCSQDRQSTAAVAVPRPDPPATVAPLRTEPVAVRRETPPPETPAPAPSFAEGEAAYHAKKYAESLSIFEAYVQRRPRNGWGHYMLALSAWKAGDLAKAEQAFANALKIDPGHIKSHVNLSRVLIAQNRQGEALEQLTRAADIDPESLEVHRLLGRTYHTQGQTEEAMQMYHRALELNPHDAWTLNYLGLVMLDTEHPEDALPLFVQAVQLRKDVAEFHNNLGVVLERIGHHSAAATAYGSALRADPGYDAAKQNLARLAPEH